MKKRSKFSLSRTWNMSGSPGELLPLGPPVEVLPGDSHQLATTMLIRVLPLLAPVMHPFDVKIHHWFVATRTIWEEFEEFITGGPDNDSTVIPPFITAPSGGVAVGSLADYQGVPPMDLSANGGAAFRHYSALPARGYAFIYNNFYRDQDLQAEVPMSLASGSDATTSTALLFANWQKDYFTSARPWEAKGPTVMLPLTGDAPVKSMAPPAGGLGILDPANADMAIGVAGGFAIATGTPQIPANRLFSDLSQVSAATMLQLRLAMALQRYAENRARFGSRYPEYLLALGVRPDDARLSLPEYLGGGQQTLTFSEVLQTAPTTNGVDTVGVGNLKGHGIGALRSNKFRKFFSEHGFIHSFAVVRPRTVYPQGLPRIYSKLTKEDYWQPELEHIGQQEILKKEIYWGGADPDGMWGFQDRYDEYRRLESGISGDFRTTLNFWHAARIFTSRPALNAAFVLSNPTNRIYSVTSDTVDKLWMQVRHNHHSRRLLSRTGSSFSY